MKRSIKTLHALLVPLSVLILALWAVCMCLMTVNTARKEVERLAQKLHSSIYLHFTTDIHTPEGAQRRMLSDYQYAFEGEDVELAMVLYDNHELIANTREVFMMEYITQDNWFLGIGHPQYYTQNGIVYIDPLWIENDVLRHQWEDNPLQADVIRLSGCFSRDGTFYPYEIATFNKGFRYSLTPFSRLGPKDQYSLLKGWETIWSMELEAYEQTLNLEEFSQDHNGLYILNSQTLYCISDMHYGRYVPEAPDLRLLLNDDMQRKLENPRASGTDTSTGNLLQTDLFGRCILQEDDYTDHYDTPRVAEVMLRCYPLKAAMKQLWYMYPVTLLAAVVWIILCRKWLKRWLEAPIQQLMDCEENQKRLREPVPTPLQELQWIQENYMNLQQEQSWAFQETTRMRTALEYAQDAENNRRQLVSNITHELKTPLAVIRTYCEGLQAGIAPEKQQKYLDVITAEADRMDAMVLEMLDLSRLEAGKVRLAQDRVELLGLTRGILEKLEPLMEVKNLSWEFAIAQSCPLTADENRLTQVVTNLVSNAIKYSPEGGKIILNVFQKDGQSHFSIENQSEPLSQEALEKIWDSFYRTEQSRTSKGTGLGLPICKTIIELHSGTCQAQNTSTGVEFSFSIP